MMKKNSNESEIVEIQFAFKNKKLISLLEERGGHINKLNWKKLATADEKLANLFRNEENRKEMQQIVQAFISFKS